MGVMKPSQPAALLFVGLTALASFPSATQADPKPQPACIRSGGEARARTVGWDHVVWIENGCEKAATCVVTTDVAPEPVTQVVGAKQRVELTTFRGSPASAFKPKVDCKLDAR